MAAYFFDSSAIAKRYHWESGSAWIRAICSPRQHHRLYLSRLAHVEVVAGLRRTGRLEGMHSAAIDAMVNTFERQLALSTPDRPTSIYHLLPVSDAVLSLAAALCDVYAGRAVHPLRSLDAIQLASAITEASTLNDELLFITADAHLAAIAEDEGFRVINPAFPPSPWVRSNGLRPSMFEAIRMHHEEPEPDVYHHVRDYRRHRRVPRLREPRAGRQSAG